MTPASIIKSKEDIGTYVPHLRELIPVRVRDIILDESHPEYKEFDGIHGVGVIKYSSIDSEEASNDTKTLGFAFPLNSFGITFPLINEIVFLVKGPREDQAIGKLDYYLTTVGLYNDINYLPLVSSKIEKDSKGPGFKFKENQKIRPLYPYHGDTILQGRSGQSIRLTGAKSPKNTITVDNNANKPFIVITNGHKEVSDKELYVEDINKDLSSIYITSDHKIPLKQSRDKYAGAQKRPVPAGDYKGNQIIINSGRLFLNTTEEDIQFSSLKGFGITSEEISIDSKNYIGLDSKKIYLGEQARIREAQPAVLGNNLEQLLDTLFNTLESVGGFMKKAKTIDQKPVPQVNLAGILLEETIKNLKKSINPGKKDSLLKSKKVFIE